MSFRVISIWRGENGLFFGKTTAYGGSLGEQDQGGFYLLGPAASASLLTYAARKLFNDRLPMTARIRKTPYVPDEGSSRLGGKEAINGIAIERWVLS